jgi:hypothetical protein
MKAKKRKLLKSYKSKIRFAVGGCEISVGSS